MKLVLILAIFIFSVYLFNKCCNIIDITRVNIISLLFYSITVQCFLGASLIFMGYDRHYLIRLVTQPTTILKTFLIVSYVLVSIPLFMYIMNRLLKQDTRMLYSSYLKSNVVIDNNREAFIILSLLTLLCVAACSYVFMKIGRIPFFDFFMHKGNEFFSIERINIKFKFSGNQYIRNLLGLVLTPFISYCNYVYAKSTKEKKWIFLFLISFLFSIFIVTYDYEKAPILYYLGGFFLIEIILKDGIKVKKLISFTALVVIMIVLMYKVLSPAKGPASSFSIYTGPFGRIVYTQVAALFLHIDAFPLYVPFLNGASFPQWIVNIILPGTKYIRSGRYVMQLFNPVGVEKGIAGVMSTLFVGEAYANFSILGVILSTLYVALLLNTIFTFFIRSKKNPINVALFITLTISMLKTIQGGFVDFIYNPSVIFTIGVAAMAQIAMMILIKLEHRFAPAVQKKTS